MPWLLPGPSASRSGADSCSRSRLVEGLEDDDRRKSLLQLKKDNMSKLTHIGLECVQVNSLRQPQPWVPVHFPTLT